MIKFISNVILLFFTAQVLGQQTCTEQDYNKKVTSKHRFTTVQPGNYSVQALITFTDGENCNKVTKDGLVKTLAIQYAIDRLNQGELKKYNTKLGLQLDDVCRSLPVTMARGIEVVSLHRPNSVCRADFLKCDSSKSIKEVDVKQATAVIGTQMSFTTIPLASLMSLYYIPQVSFAASSRLLSKKELYKSFFRTIPSDTKQISVILDIIKKFEWNYVFAVGSDDDYGKLGVSDLKREAGKFNVCIPYDEYIPYQSSKTDERVLAVVKKIRDEKRAKVVVLFCYVDGLGDKILRKAEELGVKRVWLTSEAWNPTATSLFSMNDRNQTEGLLSVSLKSYPMPNFERYMRKKVASNVDCNMWLQQYLLKSTNCTSGPYKNVDNETISCGDVNITVDSVMNQLSVLPGKIDNLIDSTTALGKAILKVLESSCPDPSACFIPEMKPKNVTDQMFDVSFINDQDRTISFDKNGDPLSAFYTIENIQVIDGKYKYIPVGNWTQTDGDNGDLELDLDNIIWPSWWQNDSKTNSPSSRCSVDCQPGTAVVGRSECCWNCQNCTKNNYTNEIMADQCVSCGNYSYTKNNIDCKKIPILWVKITDPAGMSITLISVVGMIIILVTSAMLMKVRKMIVPHDIAPHLVAVACGVLIVTFVFGPLHIMEPTDALCQTRNGIFFMVLMMYSAILLTRSRFMTGYLQKHADKSCKGNLMIAQCVYLVLMFLLELASVFAWIYIDPLFLEEFREDDQVDPANSVIWRQCRVSFTAARLVSTFIPCIILIIATFCAFRERNREHSFYEPKFLSFTCIAMCIIIVAFLPTFKYVIGIYKAIVMAFTMDVFAYTFMACMVLPRLYVGTMRHKRGIGEYPLKPGTASKKSEKEKVKEIRSQTSMQSSNNDRTESSAIESSMISKNRFDTADSPSSQPNDNKLDERDEEGIEVTEPKGYNNTTYDKDDKEPPVYANGDVMSNEGIHLNDGEHNNGQVHTNGGIESDCEEPPPYEEIDPKEPETNKNTKM